MAALAERGKLEAERVGKEEAKEVSTADLEQAMGRRTRGYGG